MSGRLTSNALVIGECCNKLGQYFIYLAVLNRVIIFI